MHFIEDSVVFMINFIEWKYNFFREILLLTLEWLSKHTTSTNNQRFQVADKSVLKKYTTWQCLTVNAV